MRGRSGPVSAIRGCEEATDARAPFAGWLLAGTSNIQRRTPNIQ